MALAACGAPVGGSARERNDAPQKRNAPRSGIVSTNASAAQARTHRGAVLAPALRPPDRSCGKRDEKKFGALRAPGEDRHDARRCDDLRPR